VCPWQVAVGPSKSLHLMAFHGGQFVSDASVWVWNSLFQALALYV